MVRNQVVTQISENTIVDNEVRKDLTGKLSTAMDELKRQVDSLQLSILALGQLLIALCDVIDSLSNVNAIKQKYRKMFYGEDISQTQDSADPNHDYKNVPDNVASILLQLAKGQLSFEARNGAGNLPTERWKKIIEICGKNNCEKFLYSITSSSGSGSIHDEIKDMFLGMEAGRGNYKTNIEAYKEEKNIF